MNYTTTTHHPDRTARETLAVNVANITCEDAQFLRNCIALLTDPAHIQHMADVRSGQSRIAYQPRGGLAVIAEDKKS